MHVYKKREREGVDHPYLKSFRDEATLYTPCLCIKLERAGEGVVIGEGHWSLWQEQRKRLKD